MISTWKNGEKQNSEEWEAYRRIVNEYKDIRYESIHYLEICKQKEARVDGCYFENHFFSIANSARDILDVDLNNFSFDLFGKTKIGTFKWTGTVLYQDLIYAFPRKENSFLVLNPRNKEILEKRIGTHYHGEHHYGGVCTDEGIVYQPPRNEDHILRTNLNDFSVAKIMMFEDGTKARYSATIYHPNGLIYLIPEFGFKVMVFDPFSGEKRFIGNDFKEIVFSPVVGYDGNIYGFCKEGKGVLKIDIDSEYVDFVCTSIGNPDCFGSLVGINGRIYGVPGSGRYIWEFDIDSQKAERIYELKSFGYAYYAGGGIGSNGVICMMPCFGDRIYFLKPDKKVQLTNEEVDNRFFNKSF